MWPCACSCASAWSWLLLGVTSSMVGRLSVDDLCVSEWEEEDRVASRCVLREVRRVCDLRLELERDLSLESLMFPSDVKFPVLFAWETICMGSLDLDEREDFESSRVIEAERFSNELLLRTGDSVRDDIHRHHAPLCATLSRAVAFSTAPLKMHPPRGQTRHGTARASHPKRPVRRGPFRPPTRSSASPACNTKHFKWKRIIYIVSLLFSVPPVRTPRGDTVQARGAIKRIKKTRTKIASAFF